MRFKYCPICGKELIEKYSWDEGGVPYCPYDKVMFFDTPKPCIIAAVVRGDEVILLKQSYIYKNSKVLVSGYITSGEDVKNAVKREIKEETGLTVDDPFYLGSYYVSEKEILMLTFICQYKSGDIIKSDEVEGIEWMKIDEALEKMQEDFIGRAVVEKVIKIKDRLDDKDFKYIKEIQNI